MTRYVVDASAVLHLASARFEVPGEHELLAPTLLRSEYVALTQLHADAFVTLDAELARRVEGIVAIASIDVLDPAGPRSGAP